MNQILKSHGFQQKTVSSPVLCGRDCAISPQCQSFNYHPSTHLCVLKNATRSNNLDDLVHLLGWVYYGENMDTPLIETNVSPMVTTPTTAAVVTHQAPTTPMSPGTDVTSSAAIGSQAPTTPMAFDTSAEMTHRVTSSATVDTHAPTTPKSPDIDVTSSAAIDTQAPTTSMSPDTDVTSTAATNTIAPATTPMASDTSAEMTKQVTSSATFKSCRELLLSGTNDNGNYTIYPDGLLEGVQVYCDMETDGGGWIVFQRRQDGSVDFYRNWAEYQSGFGDLNGEFWLGNNNLRALTTNGQWQLLIELEDWAGGKFWAAYEEFAVSGNLYTLHIGSYDMKSTVGDSMLYHDGYPFTTKDQDNDNMDYNCAVRKEGAWWFESCFKAHLNGKYYDHSKVDHALGIQWKAVSGGFYYSLKSCAMKIREVR
ncbi:uncharacterized protein [Asterias amurensis]|uniref:uncharacterized protein n=1 Tax=Asterias amurensis TaxID=7602 RepID=UPI003AB8CB02